MQTPTATAPEEAPILPVSLSEAEKRTAALKLANMVRPLVAGGLTTLSKTIGRERNFLGRKLGTGDVPVSLLVCLSWAVHRNMLDHYLAMLPIDCRETAITRELRNEIEQLKAQNEAEKKETEKWKEKYEFVEGVLRGKG